MYSSDQLSNEIKQCFGNLEQANKSVNKNWLVRSVMSRHRDVTGEDAPFALYCAEAYVTKEVEALFRSIAAKEIETTEEQFSLEGFGGEYNLVRARYLVSRDGESVAVPVLEMTYEERAAKVAALRSHAHGTLEHARQLERLNDKLLEQKAQ
jgi:hypothetical protein